MDANKFFRSIRNFLFVIVVLSLVLTACSRPTDTPMPTAILVPSATPLPTATFAPIVLAPEPTPSTQYVYILTKYMGSKIGTGGFLLEASLKELETGGYESEQIAREMWSNDPRVSQLFKKCKPNFHWSLDRKDVEISKTNSVSVECWIAYTALTGQTPFDKLISDITEQLYVFRDSASQGDFIYIQRDGKILGRSGVDLDYRLPCAKAALDEAGVDGESFFKVSVSKAVTDLLRQSAVDYVYLPTIADYCNAQGFVVNKNTPDWPSIYRGNDMFRFTISEFVSVSIHTDPEICDAKDPKNGYELLSTEYPQWHKGDLLVEVQGRDQATREPFYYVLIMSEGNVMKFVKNHDTPQLFRTVYLTIIDGKVVWLRPITQSSYFWPLIVKNTEDDFTPWMAWNKPGYSTVWISGYGVYEQTKALLLNEPTQ
jgi:hypothetical protein